MADRPACGRVAGSLRHVPISGSIHTEPLLGGQEKAILRDRRTL